MQGMNTPGSLQRGIIPRSFEVSDDLIRDTDTPMADFSTSSTPRR